MNNSLSKLGLFIALTSVSISCWSQACMPIARVCMQMGYYKGGDKVGKGLVKNCVMPVTMGSKTLPNTNFSPSQLQQCKAEIEQKMKSQN